MILEQSKAQADREAELIKKNEELLKIMAQMEDEKKAAQASQGWGFNKKQVEEKTGDELQDMAANLNKAIAKIEVADQAKGSKKKEESKDGGYQGTVILLEKTRSNKDQSLEDRQNQLQDYKDKLIEARNAERKEDLMRATFMKMDSEHLEANKSISKEQNL